MFFVKILQCVELLFIFSLIISISFRDTCSICDKYICWKTVTWTIVTASILAIIFGLFPLAANDFSLDAWLNRLDSFISDFTASAECFNAIVQIKPNCSRLVFR